MQPVHSYLPQLVSRKHHTKWWNLHKSDCWESNPNLVIFHCQVCHLEACVFVSSFSHCNKRLEIMNWKIEIIILTYSFGGLRPWAVWSIAWSQWHIMAGVKPIHLMSRYKRESGKDQHFIVSLKACHLKCLIRSFLLLFPASPNSATLGTKL
jgi:hypothetical protein